MDGNEEVETNRFRPVRTQDPWTLKSTAVSRWVRSGTQKSEKLSSPLRTSDTPRYPVHPLPRQPTSTTVLAASRITPVGYREGTPGRRPGVPRRATHLQGTPMTHQTRNSERVPPRPGFYRQLGYPTALWSDSLSPEIPSEGMTDSLSLCVPSPPRVFTWAGSPGLF